MQELRAPLAEINARFSRSELYMMGWRAQEMYADMADKFTSPAGRKLVVPTGELPTGLPAKFYNEDGEIDLRKVTGKEAWQYFQSMGIALPIVHRAG